MKHVISHCLLATLCWVFSGLCPGQETVKIRIDPGRSWGAVKKHVLGHNIEAANSKGIFGTKDSAEPTYGEGLWLPETREYEPTALALSKEIGIGMLRYPGGCLAHNFNWKEAVGPVAERTYFSFGMDEYLDFCKEIGATPLMNVSAYVGGPQDAAELVEYLNAPATPEHPWAMKRAAWGHPEPFGVTFFEMGNESDHGNHDVQPFRQHTPHTYADWFNACVDKMKAVDASIQIGFHVGTGTPVEDPWNRVVFTRCAPKADFVAAHTYASGMFGDRLEIDSGLLMQSCMAAGEQIHFRLRRYRELLKTCSGKDLPFAITEYNGMFVNDKPVPYRFSFGAALFSADYARSLLAPDSNVIIANYWQYINGYWGFLGGKNGGPITKKRPGYYLYRLWGQHFGEELVQAEVMNSPAIEFPGVLRAKPALAKHKERRILNLGAVAYETGDAQKPNMTMTKTGPDSGKIEVVDLMGEAYPEFGRFEAQGGKNYAITFEGRVVESTKKSGMAMGLGLVDARGWDETHSACAAEGIDHSGEWIPCYGAWTTLPDVREGKILWRIKGDKATPFSGVIEFRNLKIEEIEEQHPPYKTVTTCASLSADKKKLYLIVFNKHHAEDATVQVDVADGSVAGARLWQVTSPRLEATNLDKQEVDETISGEAFDEVQPGGFTLTLPAFSMSAIEIDRK